jgi:hypothetical protein
METLSFAEAMRRLIGDAHSNFARFRGRNREPGEPVVTEFDIAFAVEGAYDTCLSLLDYWYPRATLRIYRGTDASAAELAFEVYDERLHEVLIGTRRPSEYVDAECRWKYVYYETAQGPLVTLTHGTSHRSEPATYDVSVEVVGHDIECIEGEPEDSPWHIFFAGSPLQAKPRRTKPALVRKGRNRPGKGRDNG